MDNTNTIEQLRQQARDLFAKSTNMDSKNRFITEFVLENEKSSEATLKNLCDQLEKFNQAQEENYNQYKTKISKALADYKTSISAEPQS